MNKISLIVLPVVLVFGGVPVFAQTIPATNNSAAVQKMMASRYGATGSPMGMNPMVTKEKIEKIIESMLEIGLLYKMLEQPSMVSTPDGFVVAYGNSLRKYDKDLNVVKQVDLDVNVDGMQDLAAKFAKKYSNDFMDLMGGMPGVPSAAAGTTPGAFPSSATIAAPTASPSAVASASSSSSGNGYDEQREEQIKKEIEQMK